MEDAVVFINYINDHYDELFNRFKAFCNDKHYVFDADIFQTTILKCYELIEKKGLKDLSDVGIESYFFMAYKRNLQREKQYSRNCKKDNNIVDLIGLYEQYQSNQTTLNDKLKNDLWVDFVTIYLLSLVEQNFDSTSLYLFKMKVLYKDMTYKKLYENTKIKGCRQKVINVKNWLKENVDKEEVKKEFDKIYGDLIC